MEPEKRWANGRGYRKPCRIAYAIEKYGWENIKHEIVLQTESQEFVEQEEIRYINEVYHSNDKRFGYNIASGGYSSLEGVSNRGLRLYNNGKIQRYFTEPPMDSQWKLGYLPETKEKYRISAAVGAEKLRGRHWWTDGENQKFCRECPGKGWTLGHSPKVSIKYKEIGKNRKGSESCNKGKLYWNNGVENKLSEACPGPEWKRGLLRSKDAKSGNAGKSCYNNGKVQKYFLEPPADPQWVPGLLPTAKEKLSKINKGRQSVHKGKFMWNNGERFIYSIDCPGPGWKRGGIKKKDHLDK